MIELHCYYSLSSPWAYFAGPRLEDILRRHRPRLILKPYDFQAIVPLTGGVPLRVPDLTETPHPWPSPRMSFVAFPANFQRRGQRERRTYLAAKSARMCVTQHHQSG